MSAPRKRPRYGPQPPTAAEVRAQREALTEAARALREADERDREGDGLVCRYCQRGSHVCVCD